MNVLIVDDEVHVRRMMRLALEADHAVVEAADGPTALAAIRDHGPFDVVLLDQRMPGMTGVELLRQIVQTAPGTRVVMVTAHASLDLAAESFRSGARHFLCKPITPDVLRAAVRSAGAHPTAGTTPDPVAVRSDEAITLNGYTLERAGRPVRVDRDGSATHGFTVTHALGAWSRLVTVRLGPHAFHRVGSGVATGSRLAQFVARRALAEYLFREGLLPPDDRLDVGDVDSSQLAAAQRDAGAV